MGRIPTTRDAILRVLAAADGPRTGNQVAYRLRDLDSAWAGVPHNTLCARIYSALHADKTHFVNVGGRRGYALTPAGRRAAAALDAPPPPRPTSRVPRPPLPEPRRPHRLVIRLEPGELERAQRDLAVACADPELGTAAARWHLDAARHHLAAYAALKSREHEE